MSRLGASEHSPAAPVPAEFAARVHTGMVPGGVYAFGRGFKPAAEGGYGLTDPGTETAPAPGLHSAYRIASCTKSFTAALALILRDEGTLDLDRPAADYLPALSGCAPEDRQSARMFLTMSSGLAPDNCWADRQESMTPSDLDSLLLRGLPLVARPGTGFAYSNLGYAILGRIMEEASGRSYAELLTTRLLSPLGLTETSLDRSLLQVPAVPGFSRDDRGWEKVAHSGPGAFSPIGGLFSTAADMKAWIQWLAAAFGPGEDRRPGVLSAASRREMQQGQRMIPTGPDRPEAEAPRAYGFGVFVEEHPDHGPVVSHSGGYPGFSSHIRWHPATGLYGLGLENATYAAVQRPVAKTFEGMLAELPSAVPEAWPAAVKAAAEVEALIAGWDDSRARVLFADNVEQDAPLDQRRRELSALLNQTGPLDWGHRSGTEHPTPAQARWTIPGAAANLQCSLEMTPVRPERVQRLEFSVTPAETPCHAEPPSTKFIDM